MNKKQEHITSTPATRLDSDVNRRENKHVVLDTTASDTGLRVFGLAFVWASV